MGDAPERIWAFFDGPFVGMFVSGGNTEGITEYVHADRHAEIRSAADELANLSEKASFALNQAFGAGIEEREFGSARRQEKLMDEYIGWLKSVKSALAAYRKATEADQ